jgi:trimeric autotransporter adhesin
MRDLRIFTVVDQIFTPSPGIAVFNESCLPQHQLKTQRVKANNIDVHSLQPCPQAVVMMPAANFKSWRGWRCRLALMSLLVWPSTLAAQESTPAQTLSITGVVRSGNTPIPGATVTAANTATGEKFVVWTEMDGAYRLSLPTPGKYALRVEMTAFTPATREVMVSDSSTRADVGMILESRARQNAQTEHARSQQNPGGGQRGAGARANRGFQSLAVMQNEAAADAANAGNDQVVPSGMPVPGIAPDAATESVAITGNASGVGMFGMSSDEIQQRMRESREQDAFGSGQGGTGVKAGVQGGGGPPGGGLGGGGLAGAGGGFGGGGSPFGGGSPKGDGSRGMLGRGRFDMNRPHAMFYYSAGDSALNAAPYSLTGPSSKAGYIQQRFGVSVGGPLNIPKIYKGGTKTFFFFNYNGARGESPYDAFSTVPTLAERSGDFSDSTMLTHDSNGNAVRVPVQLFYSHTSPCAGQPIPGNNLKNSAPSCAPLSPIAQGLLNYIPLPNLPGTDVENFHYVTSALNNSDDLNIRLNRALGGSSAGPRRGGPRNNLSFGMHYHSAGSNLTNPFPSVGGSSGIRSFDVPISYARSFGKVTNIARLDFNRSRTSTQNLYAFSQNVTGSLGITGVSENPFDWGIPNLSFTNFGSLTDTNPQLLRNQTWTFSDNMIWNHGKHTLRWGGDFRRIQLNTETSNNARGTFIFTGLNTAGTQIVAGQSQPVGGFDLADFLLGLPQQNSVQFGANNYHFRGNSWDLYAQDGWRLRSNLTFNLGLRYEYLSPFSELNDLIVNLDLPNGFTAPPVPVRVGQSGPYHGQLPATLVRPDRNNFAPRLGIAWKPLGNMVVRAGYGINYNTSAYQSMVQNMAFQPPFATTTTNIESASTPLTLENIPIPTGVITNNFGVDPNYRLGYVQIWNLDIQQQLRPTLIVNFDYTGTKGTRLDILEAPNRTATGVLFPGAQPFFWEDSLGDSSANAGSIRVRKRLQTGFSIGGRYTFSKSLDNASTIGSGEPLVAQGGNGRLLITGTTNVAQNAFDLAAERGLSSFDQTHQFTADYLWQLPFGHDRHWLTGNTPWRAIFGDWQWSGDWTIASGLPFTPRVLGAFSDVSRGTNGTLRADVVPGESVSIPDPTVKEWFNVKAFVAPPAGQFGNARRNSIIGPGTRLFDMSFTKVIPLRESRMLELRAQVSNVFNTPQFNTIDTIVNSPTFGRVTSVGAMRTLLLAARFRF